MRIGHGFRALEDHDLVALLRDRAIPIEGCPPSKVALGRVPSFAGFRRSPGSVVRPVPLFAAPRLSAMVAAVPAVTLNTDIPAGPRHHPHRRVRAGPVAFGWPDREPARTALAGVGASFARPNSKTSCAAGIGDWLR